MSLIKTAISLDSTLLEEVDSLAKQMEIARSRVFVLAVKNFIKNYQNKKLLDSINNAFDDGFTDEEKDLNEKMRNHHVKMVKDQW